MVTLHFVKINNLSCITKYTIAIKNKDVKYKKIHKYIKHHHTTTFH